MRRFTESWRKSTPTPTPESMLSGLRQADTKRPSERWCRSGRPSGPSGRTPGQASGQLGRHRTMLQEPKNKHRRRTPRNKRCTARPRGCGMPCGTPTQRAGSVRRSMTQPWMWSWSGLTWTAAPCWRCGTAGTGRKAGSGTRRRTRRRSMSLPSGMMGTSIFLVNLCRRRCGE